MEMKKKPKYKFVVDNYEGPEELLENMLSNIGGGQFIVAFKFKESEYMSHILDDKGNLPNYEGMKTVPLYAHIHSRVTFELSPSCKWDSGRAGAIAYDNSVSDKELSNYLAVISAIWNGEVYDISLVEEEVCDKCGNIEDIYIDNIITVDYEKGIKELAEIHGIKLTDEQKEMRV